MIRDTFKIVKARSLDESDESCIDITCRLCSKTVNFAGTFENVRAKRNDFVNNHSCPVIDVTLYSGSGQVLDDMLMYNDFMKLVHNV